MAAPAGHGCAVPFMVRKFSFYGNHLFNERRRSSISCRAIGKGGRQPGGSTTDRNIIIKLSEFPILNSHKSCQDAVRSRQSSPERIWIKKGTGIRGNSCKQGGNSRRI